jgi:2-dehydropantoate 2-reductase
MFIAHSLKQTKSPPPVTLLMPSVSHISKWGELGNRSTISVHFDNMKEKSDGFLAELARPPLRLHGRTITSDEFFQDDRPVNPHWDKRSPGPPLENDPFPPDFNNKSSIDYLIMAVKPGMIVPRLLGIRHRLHPNSTVLLVHQGLGVLEEITTSVFPDPETRPSLIQGLSTHRVYPVINEHFAVNCYRPGSLTISPLPKFNSTLFEPSAFENANDIPPSTEHLISTLKNCPNLLANDTNVTDLFLSQVERLVVDSIIEPLSSLVDCRNGQLLYNYYITTSLRLLLTEISLVVRALPELQSYPNLETRFAPDRLESLVVERCYQYGGDLSPMALDVRAGHGTQIDYLNGWIIRRGEELGLKCWMNYLTMQMVKGKRNTVAAEVQRELPLVRE